MEQLTFDDAADQPKAEEWRPVPGFPIYEASDLGRVRSVDRPYHPGRVLKPWFDDTGYMHVTLYRNGKAKKPYVHQVIAWTFLGPCPEGQEVRHGPNGKLDNSRSNLEYGTHFDNCSLDTARDGTRAIGERHGNAKYTLAVVGECRTRFAAGESLKSLAAEFGVSVGGLASAVAGITWTHCPVPPVTGRKLGSQHRDAKLNEDIVRECRARHAAGETASGLAREFGVSEPSMSNAIHRRTWKHVA